MKMTQFTKTLITNTTYKTGKKWQEAKQKPEGN